MTDTDTTVPNRRQQPTSQPGRAARYLLLGFILVLPVAALLWMALGRSPKPVEALTDGEVTRRSTPEQAVAYALPQASHPIAALTLPDGSEVKAEGNLPRDRDQLQIYAFNQITALVGREAQQRYFPVEDFARRLARTAADLPRHYLPSSFWPVRATAGRFEVESSGGKTFIAPGNAARYAPLVQLVSGLETSRLVSAYVKGYPVLQKAYASLGHNYASYYFNDTVIAAIDELLRTPQPQGPIEVVLPAAGDAHADAARPWVTYRYADPALESLSVGQKTLLRMGPDNARAVQAKLAEIRALLVDGRAAAD